MWYRFLQVQTYLLQSLRQDSHNHNHQPSCTQKSHCLHHTVCKMIRSSNKLFYTKNRVIKTIAATKFPTTHSPELIPAPVLIVSKPSSLSLSFNSSKALLISTSAAVAFFMLFIWKRTKCHDAVSHVLSIATMF